MAPACGSAKARLGAPGARRPRCWTTSCARCPSAASGHLPSVPIILASFWGIPLRLENPKIGRVDDAEIVGNRIAEDGPVFRHLHAQEMQNGSAEVVVARVASVVGHVAMHQPP